MQPRAQVRGLRLHFKYALQYTPLPWFSGMSVKASDCPPPVTTRTFNVCCAHQAHHQAHHRQCSMASGA
jgi:hypothetical protein